MRTLYSIAIGLFAAGVRLASLWNAQARRLCTGWRDTAHRTDFDKLNGKPVAWFHAASLGEFEQARPVMELLRQRHPQYKVVLTFFSPSGYEVRKNYDGADLVCYLPPDTRRAARRLVERMQPDVAFFVKYEFWFNTLEALRQRGTLTYSFSTIMRPQQYFFQWYGGWFAQQLKDFKMIFVQNEETLHLLHSVGMERCMVTGDTRFDRVADIAAQARHFEAVERFVGEGKPVLVAGSTWEPDEAHLAAFVQHYEEPLKLIVAPHLIDEAHLRQIESRFDKSIRYSRLCANDGAQEASACQTLIIDNIGMLSSLYRYATVAYIGGGFGKGIHNTLEAAVFGCPVCFGPNHRKFQEAMDLKACGGGASYETGSELEQLLRRWLGDEAAYKRASQACRHYMDSHIGAAKQIMEKVEQG